MTPEGKVKAKVKTILNAAKPDCYYFMPVPTGYGKRTVDFIGAHKGQAFAIETKKPGQVPTATQRLVMGQMHDAGMAVFVIDDTTDEAMSELVAFMKWIDGMFLTHPWPHHAKT